MVLASVVPAARAEGIGPAVTPVASTLIEEGLRRQAERNRAVLEAFEARRAPIDALPQDALVEAMLPTLPDERPCFLIDEFRLIGPEAQRFHWLAALAEPLAHRCVGTLGVGLIVRYLGAELIRQGYATSRVSLPPQNLAQGRLLLRLHAGRVSAIDMVDADTHANDDRWGRWFNAFPTAPGRLLNVRDLEQGVEQMKRLPSQQVSTVLSPGADPDSSDLRIERRMPGPADRWHGGLTIDNAGAASLGRTQVSAHLALDNPLSLNDIASISVNGNAEHPASDHRTQSVSVHYSVPFGYGLLSAGTSHSRFGQNIALTTTHVLSRGESDTASLRWDHVLWRTAGSRTGGHVEVSTREARSFIDDLELSQGRRRTTFLEAGASFRQVYPGNGSIDVSLGYRQGMSWMAAQDDLGPEAGGTTLRPRFWAVDASVVLPQPTWRYAASMHGQFTNHQTTAIDQIAIGSRSSVRGFDGDAVLLAESGWTWRNELSTPFGLGGVDGSIYIGVDAGRVWGPSDLLLVGRALAGSAIGVRGRWNDVLFDLAAATPLVKPEGFRTARTNVYASASRAF